MLQYISKAGGGITGTFFLLCGGGSERARRALALCESFADREYSSKVGRLKKLPETYNVNRQIFSMAKKLGQSEQQIREQYTFEELAERSLFDVYDNYVEREAGKMK